MKLKIAALGAKGIPHPGGIEIVMEEIGSRLIKRGHQFDIFVRNHYMKDKPFSSYKGIGLPRTAGLHNKYLDALSHSVSAIPDIIGNKYNIIYINSVGLSVLAWLPRMFGRKVVVHTHGLDWKRDKWGPVAKRLIRMSAWSSVKLPNLTFCVCLEDKRFLENVCHGACQYVPNGIPAVIRRRPDEIKKLGLEEMGYFLFMARLVPEKGAHFLLDAWHKLTAEDKGNRKLVIAGDSNHRDAYYRCLQEFNRFEDIIFPGFAVGKLKQELLSNALCFVQPSTIEGMPISLLEAMGYGRMILASDIQENLDALAGQGRTFRSRDVDDLARKLAAILQMEEDPIRQEGEILRKTGLENYNWDRIVDNVEKQLTDILSN